MSFSLAILLLLPRGILTIRASRYALSCPKRVLMPFILVFC